MTNTTALLHLRIIVLTLGEQHHNRWWPSQFLSPTGLSFLERLYPRSAFAAAVRSAARAARQAHDAAIGQGDIAHLLRLPPAQEQALDQQLATHATRLAEAYRPLLVDRAALLARLDALADEFEIQPLAGPIRLKPETPEDLAPALAAIYVQAFRAGKPVYPYFLPEQAKQSETTP
jgi:hypothetical protein